MIKAERYIEKLFYAAALFCAAVTLAVFLLMIVSGLPFFSSQNILHFFIKPWAPLEGSWGIYQMITGSFFISFGAVVFAFPICTGYTVFVTLYAPRKVKRLFKNIIVMMSGIPTVIYGFVGIFLLVPFVRNSFGNGSGLCVLSASLLLALVISPTMVLSFYSSFKNVPTEYINAIKALGGRRSDIFLYGYLPYTWNGIVAGLLLGFGRAVGDTLIALMIAGNAALVPHSILDSARTLTSHVALVFAADFESNDFRSIYAAGITLYVLTIVLALGVRSATLQLHKRSVQ
jgi:phosphate transport system permease protein